MHEFDDNKLRVLEASDIAGVIGEYVNLKPKGREFVCLCPFHDDHNPSMYVVPHKRMFHCFVCGAGGDVFTFMQRYHGIDFPEALRMLADRAGIELKRPERAAGGRGAGAGREPGERLSRGQLVEAVRVAQRFFLAILREHPSGRAARELVERRGISPEMVERFEIGAAPDRWDGLVSTIRARNLPEAPFLATGLIKRRERPDPYDALRNRLVFTIHGETGEPIAFGGRRVNDEDEPKYLNSPESPLFNKSKTLFGLPMARPAIRKTARAVVVEGYTDVIACHQAGLENVVGTLGTAFTAGHAQKLRGQCDEIVLLFDGDEAGQAAADRAFEVLIGSRVDIRVATLSGATDAKDPDELLARPGGSDELRRILDDAEPVIDRWARRIHERQATLGPASRARFLDEQVGRLASQGLENLSPIERDSMLASLGEALGVPHRVLNETYQRSRASGRRAGPRGQAAPGVGRSRRVRPVDRFRVHLLSGLLDAGGTAGVEPERLARALRVDLSGCPPELARLVEDACAQLEQGEAPDATRLLAPIDDPETSAWLSGLLASSRGGEAGGEDVQSCLERLEAHGLVSREPGAESGHSIRTDPSSDRLARLRALHAGHGGNTGANPYRFGGFVSPGGEAGVSGVFDSGSFERSEDGQDQADDTGAAPGSG